MLPIAQPRSLHLMPPQPGTGLASNWCAPSAGEVWRIAPGPAADRSRMSGGREITKRPRASIVGRLFDNSTKKTQTLNYFRSTLNDRGVYGRTGTRGWLALDARMRLPTAPISARVVVKVVPATTLVGDSQRAKSAPASPNLTRRPQARFRWT
jgi:hypothetical protein